MTLQDEIREEEARETIEEIAGTLISTPPPMTLAFYRTKTALRIKLIYPNVRPGDKYPQLGGYMFTFAESATEGSKFGWDKDQAISFFMSATEVGGFVNAVETGTKLDIFHDPDKGKSNEGSRSKSLSLNSGFLNMSTKERKIGIKISPADERQLALMLGHSLRLCYGWF